MTQQIQQTQQTTDAPTDPATTSAKGPVPGPAPEHNGKSAIIVGAGLAGLAAAVELLGKGWRVTVIEKNDHLGGKMNLIEDRGYAFDMGPTIITLPQVLRGIVERSGRKPEDYIDLIDLDPQWRCLYEDGTVIDLRRDTDQMLADLTTKYGEPTAEGYRTFLEHSRRMMRLSEKVFYYNDLGGIGDLMRAPPTEPGVLGDVMAMRMHSTVAATIHKHIPEPHVQQMCEHFLQYVGSSPFLAPAILTLIAAAQSDNGCWYPMGGTRMVARTLERLAMEMNVDAITGRLVTRLVETDGRVTGVTLDDGTTLTADCVISNCDVQRTYRDLSDSPKANEAARSVASKYRPACSGLVLYLGLDRAYDHIAHHNFAFSANSEQEFDDIYNKGVPARDPTVYIAAPSRTDPAQAPAGGEALYLLIHTAPNPSDQPDRWEKDGGLLPGYRKVVLDKLKRFGMEDIEDRIVVEHHLTPDGIDRRYNAEGGAIYGLASHGKLKGGFKPRNRSTAIKGLYLTGGSVNPGPGVPMVLMSGVTAARAVCEDFNVDIEPRAQLRVAEGDRSRARVHVAASSPALA